MIGDTFKQTPFKPQTEDRQMIPNTPTRTTFKPKKQRVAKRQQTLLSKHHLNPRDMIADTSKQTPFKHKRQKIDKRYQTHPRKHPFNLRDGR